MNGRILLSDGVSYLQSLPGDPFAGVHIGTIYNSDYITKFPVTAPAVWFVGKQLTRIDDGHGYSTRMRQHCLVEIAIRVTSSRLNEGEVDAEPALNTLADNLSEALFGWMIPGAEDVLAWVRAKDGPTFQSIVVADFVFSTTVTYIK